MNESMKGETLFETRRTIHELKLEELGTALGTRTAPDTATLVTFFGPSIPGEALFVDRMQLDFSKALLGGLTYEWARPFRVGETVDVKTFVEDMYEKSNLQFAVVTTEFRDAAGDVIQVQKATFIERGA